MCVEDTCNVADVCMRGYNKSITCIPTFYHKFQICLHEIQDTLPGDSVYSTSLMSLFGSSISTDNFTIEIKSLNLIIKCHSL